MKTSLKAAIVGVIGFGTLLTNTVQPTPVHALSGYFGSDCLYLQNCTGNTFLDGGSAIGGGGGKPMVMLTIQISLS